MKAWKLHNINSIKQEEIDMPVLRGGEVLVAVKAAGICGSDIPRIYRDGAHHMPLIPGHEFSGEVVQIGKWVDEEWLHKRVGIYPLIPCRECISCRKGQFEMCKNYSYLGSRQDGGFAEYVAVPVRNLICLPDNVSFEQAAMLEPMAVAVHAMRRAQVAQNSRVVVYGLGTIGLLLVMFLLEKGITNVLVIGNKPFQKEMAIKLGVPEEHYCDCHQTDVTIWLKNHTDGTGADVVFECVGKNAPLSQSIDLAAAGGKVCVVGNPDTDMTLEKSIYWKILRNQLTIVGTWNSTFFKLEPYAGGVLPCGDVYFRYEDLDLNDESFSAYSGFSGYEESSDWEYVLHKLERKRISPEELITHRFSLEELEQGLEMMREKRECYVKVMIMSH